MSNTKNNNKVDAGSFYEEYHGHKLDELEIIHSQLADSAETTIFLAGDSSLDNKHWFFSDETGFNKASQVCSKNNRPDFVASAVNGYEGVLQPPAMVKDVAYWMNFLAAERYGPGKILTINTSVEESTVAERMRSRSGLLPHDEFIREKVGRNDVVVLSVGGNDVALRPTISTIASVLTITRMPMWLIRKMGRHTPGWGHLEWLFHDQVEKIVQRIAATGTPPKKVIVCMIYYLDERPGGSWADFTLRALGYDAHPEKLKLIIRLLFERIRERGFQARPSAPRRRHGDKKRPAEGKKGGEKDAEAEPGGRSGGGVVPFPLFEVLDGTDPGDYVQRVEPSVAGGRKMAAALLAA
ncbi:unnamed protein product, partial [Heterosigma akashiwo]